ncbi:kinase-like protein [Gloeophyllum trabeum ATCC 11539]|uniref:Kinase-like protein n=1 Tax=Gloeophyllum trabeum (strain ATCC 11539 / FP-39264 / Madison 617) TaxID=670483 RepID=S7QCJ8_GLOTA|nr:kinase-like protein [Gloeophyllum trabeum ATCC 11539]EPQ57118.1 kinase-like protein [Gloeophyllum trabeum ATCC 11539]
MAFKRTHNTSHTSGNNSSSKPTKTDDDKYSLWEYKCPVNAGLNRIKEEAERVKSKLEDIDRTKQYICSEIIDLPHLCEADKVRFTGTLQGLNALSASTELHPDILGIPLPVINILVNTLQLTIDETPIWDGPSNTDSRVLNKFRMECEAALRHICYHYDVVPPFLIIEDRDVQTPAFNSQLKVPAGYGLVYRTKWKGKDVAIKALTELTNSNNLESVSEKNVKRFRREMVVWKQVWHDSIAPLLGIWEWHEAGSALHCMVSPWAKYRDLWTYLQISPRDKAYDPLKILVNIADALSYLHAHNPPLVHSDLHPGNVLITHNLEPKLTDFGLSTFYGSLTTAGTETEKGAFQYLAPELMSFSGKRDPKPASDMYAFGCLGYTAYTSQWPWPQHRSRSAVTYVVKRLGERPARPSEPEIPEAVWTTIESCWAQDPEERMTSLEAWQRLRALRRD